MTGGYNDWATVTRQGGDLQLQRSQAMRLAAAKAFHEAELLTSNSKFATCRTPTFTEL